MRKTMVILALILLGALPLTEALACSWDGYWAGPMYGVPAGAYSSSYQEFYYNSVQLRQKLATKQTEYDTLLASQKPDFKKAARLRSEITSLHDRLTALARSYNLPLMQSGYYGGMGGYGWCW